MRQQTLAGTACARLGGSLAPCRRGGAGRPAHGRATAHDGRQPRHHPHGRVRLAGDRPARRGSGAAGAFGERDSRPPGGGEPLRAPHARAEPPARAPAGQRDEWTHEPARCIGRAALGRVGVLHTLRAGCAAQAELPASAQRRRGADPARRERAGARPHRLLGAGGCRQSDQKLLAYTVDADGSERHVLHVRDLATGRDLPDKVAEVRGSVVWSQDGKWLFYVGRDPVKWGQKVFRHRLGTPVDEDALVFEEQEEGFGVSLRVTLSDQFLVIEAGDFSTADIRLVRMSDPTSKPHLVLKRKRGEKSWATNVGDRIILLTNADNAKDWKIA